MTSSIKPFREFVKDNYKLTEAFLRELDETGLKFSKQFQPSSEPILIDFDLKTALAHPERVRTRDGKKPTQLFCFTDSLVEYPLYGVLNNAVFKWNTEGVSEKEPCDDDLFLIAETKTMWVNVYREAKTYYGSELYVNEESAEKFARKDNDYIATVPITIPVK